jgi:hypothetical protein
MKGECSVSMPNTESLPEPQFLSVNLDAVEAMNLSMCKCVSVCVCVCVCVCVAIIAAYFLF